MGLGSGIVIDSDAVQEYRECLLKAQFLIQEPKEFSLVETMLWEGGFSLLDLHLDRLTDSAEYFDFAYNRAEVRAALEDYPRGFADKAARKVRLLLDRSGAIRISDELLRAREERPGRVCVADVRTDPGDPMLYHKTTHRPLYAEAFDAAVRAGFDDVLFLNVRGEVTESAIGNLFVEKDGRWLTPPVECGLLAGVYRRHLLENRGDVEERVLREQDLRSADAVYLCNAVRELRRVQIEWGKA